MTESNRKMGFSIATLATYQWPVDVKVPVVDEDGSGAFEAHRFTGTFRHLDLEESKALMQRIKAEADQDEAPAVEGPVDPMIVATMAAQLQIDLYMEIWEGWGENLTGPDGQPLPYTDEAKRQLLGQRMIREAVIEAHRASQGGEAVRTKN